MDGKDPVIDFEKLEKLKRVIKKTFKRLIARNIEKEKDAIFWSTHSA